MRILYVAYPLQPVSASSAGGAEQVLWTLERQMHLRGHETTVAACAGSEVSGELIVTRENAAEIDSFAVHEQRHRERVLEVARSRRFDLIHDHSGHFWPHAGELLTPVLATLHLPRTFYDQDSFASLPPNIFFNCVSESQETSFAGLPQMLGVVRNAIALDRFEPVSRKSNYLLWLGRICPEKAPHVAIEAAKARGMQLVIAGQVYPFSYHQRYFEREVKPQIDGEKVRLVESPSFKKKLELLQKARAVLVTSTASETSSMVALEAMACGTPVVARRTGALPEVVKNGVTGILVESDDEFASAVGRVGAISPFACRAHVEANFSPETMARGYESVYEKIIRESIGEGRAA